MAKDIVIEKFKEETNKRVHVYQVGDKYPVSGRAKKERLEALRTNNNSEGRPFICKVEEVEETEEEVEEVEETEEIEEEAEEEEE